MLEEEGEAVAAGAVVIVEEGVAADEEGGVGAAEDVDLAEGETAMDRV